ncbi:MAG TPA: lipase, partial [Oceanospirillales bacterium]|nr:lipase [Oceanospirillales bacterium]
SNRLPTAYDCRVVISFGVNDTAIEEGSIRVSGEDSISNFEAIIKSLKPTYKRLMIGPPPISDNQHNLRIESLNQALINKAQTLEVPFIDLFSALINDKKYKKQIIDNDGAHPRGDGYEKLANIISSSTDWWF